MIYAHGGFVVERSSPYIAPQKSYEACVRDCGIGTRTSLFWEDDEEEEEMEMVIDTAVEETIPVIDVGPPPTTSADAIPPPPPKKRKARRGKGASSRLPPSAAPTPPPATPLPLANPMPPSQPNPRRHTYAKRKPKIVRPAPLPHQRPLPSTTLTTTPRPPAKQRLGRRPFLRPGEMEGIAAAAALEAANPGRKERTAKKWAKEMEKRGAGNAAAPSSSATQPSTSRGAVSAAPPHHPPKTTTPKSAVVAPRLLALPQPNRKGRPVPIFGEAVRKPWKQAWVQERLEDAQLLEADEPGFHGREVEEMQRWLNDVIANEDSDSTDDDWRPPLERKNGRSHKPPRDPYERKDSRGRRGYDDDDEEDSSE